MSVTTINGDLAWQLANGTFWYASGKQANCTVSACPIELSTYGYRPNLGASSAFIALYAVNLTVQAFLGFRYKTWWYMACTMLGCLDELLGYVGRILYYDDPWKKGPFIMQIVLITIGPVFFTAAIYVSLVQIINFISVEKSRFKPQLFVYIFLTCDIVSLILQAVGGAMSSSSDGKNQGGVDIALAGLAFQVATLIIFVGLVVDYLIRSRSVWKRTHLPSRFIVFCGFLASATILILIRCVYRIYELSQGYSRNSKALRDEGLFIALESVLVLVAAYCMIGAHPGFPFGEQGKKTEKEKLMARSDVSV